MNKIYRFSKEPMTHITHHPSGKVPQDTRSLKPNGLWLSDGMAWREWCIDENYCVAETEYVTEILLIDNPKVVMITNLKEFDEFTEKYQVKAGDAWFAHICGTNYINWAAVAKDHQGIFIMPYQWSRRLHESSFWYYGWDISSGCIWDYWAIKGIGESVRSNVLMIGNEAEQQKEIPSGELNGVD